jgi:hypothetical protein
VAMHAWPYAVSRDERSGYQAIVVPEFLADAGQAYVLEYASKGQVGPPETVTVREIRGAVTEPLSLAYRVTERRDEPGASGGPKARAGRTRRVFEGLVLEVHAEKVASLGLTVADLDAVAGITAPAFGKPRPAGVPVKAEPSAAICVGDTAEDARLLDLRMAKPWVMPGSSGGGGGSLGARPGGPGGQGRQGVQGVQGAAALPGRPDSRRSGPAHARPGRSGLIVAAAVVCTLAVLLVWYLTRLMVQSHDSASLGALALQWAKVSP